MCWCIRTCVVREITVVAGSDASHLLRARTSLCSTQVSITLNKNSIYGDRSAMSPGGVRIGTPALTTRGLVEADFERVADFLHKAVEIALDVQVGVHIAAAEMP